MSEKRLTFVVFSKSNDPRTTEIQQKIRCVLSNHEVKEADEADWGNTDYAISIGGDGTFLMAAARIGELQIPIIGINLGRLGFLADIMPEDIEEALGKVIAGEYETENHAVIQVEAEGVEGNPYALNEVAVLKRDTASMISINAEVNQEYLTTYQADGLIISTPTGSTAYNLSNGGPIMSVGADTLCMTAVAPHSLNVRPVVIDGNSKVKLTIESRSHNFLLAIDGRSETLKEGTEVSIKKAHFGVRIIRTNHRTFFSTLREKMLWGKDGRAPKGSEERRVKSEYKK